MNPVMMKAKEKVMNLTKVRKKVKDLAIVTVLPHLPRVMVIIPIGVILMAQMRRARSLRNA